MDILATDLDQTLIYGDSSLLGPNALLVEEKDGAPITYMSAYAARQLQQLRRRAWVIPVTTRSTAQYARIAFPGNWTPDLALVANGAILLEGGRRDELWFRETRTMIAPSEEEMAYGEALLRSDPHINFELRKVDEVFWFTKSDAPEETVSRLCGLLDLSLVTPLHHGSKVYLLPKALHKGRALCRLRERLACGRVFCAGDSEFDLPMLEAADLSFAPRSLVERCGILGSNVIALCGERPFSDLLLHELHKLLDE